jgi:YegS/Rv2252/BmrU family lipid kinase
MEGPRKSYYSAVSIPSPVTSLAIIVNPVSGRGTAAAPAGDARVEMARRLAASAGQLIDVQPTTGPGHAAELARDCVERGVRRVIAWGGDGTINEVAGPLIGTDTILGIVPAGSGDGLAHGLGLPRTVPEAMTAALGDRVQLVDVGLLGSRHFLNIGGIGFDAAVAEAFNRRQTRGSSGYVVDSLRSVWSYRSDRYVVDVGGERIDDSCFVVAFANCREYGSGIVLAPHASPTDGRLDMILVSGGSAWQQLWRARRLAFRRMAPAKGVRRASVTSATIRGDRLLCHVDGQTFEVRGSLTVGIRPKAIRIAMTGIGE